MNTVNLAEYTKVLEHGRGLIRHQLLRHINNAKAWHEESDPLPEDISWDMMKTNFQNAAGTTANPYNFTPDYGIRTRVANFIVNALDADWSSKEQVQELFNEGYHLTDVYIGGIIENLNTYSDHSNI